MKARLIFDRRVVVAEFVFAEMVLWELPKAVRGSLHRFKYRLALVARGECVLRYDNEAGKGDHVHIGKRERPYAFIDADRLVADFLESVRRWNDENPNS